jgi:hypothetical protein
MDVRLSGVTPTKSGAKITLGRSVAAVRQLRHVDNDFWLKGKTDAGRMKYIWIRRQLDVPCRETC